MFTTQPITMTKMQSTKLNPTPCTTHPAFMSTSMKVEPMEPMEPQGLNRLVHSPVPVVFPDEHLSYATLYPDEISIDDVIDIFNFGSLCVQIPSGPCHYPLDPLDVDVPHAPRASCARNHGTFFPSVLGKRLHTTSPVSPHGLKKLCVSIPVGPFPKGLDAPCHWHYRGKKKSNFVL